MDLSCRWVLAGFTILYGIALALYVIGTFGLFGSERGPLAGVFLIPLGLPWNRFLDSLPEASWPWFGALAPTLNIVILGLVCRWRQRRHCGSSDVH